MIIGDKKSLDDKKKLGIYVYDANEVNDDKTKRLEVMKKLQRYGVSLGDVDFDCNQGKVQEKDDTVLCKFLFKSKDIKLML
jgi:hypothetical protein